MIEFEHPLPAMTVEGREVGSYNNAEMVLPTALTTLDNRLGEFLHQLQNIIRDDRRLVFIDGRVLCCSNNWIRDNVHEMKGFKHWEYDLRSFLTFILDTQRENGSFYELIKQLDDRHWAYVDEKDRVIYPDDNVALVRLELEADVEYLVVEGCAQYYRATGDGEWLLSVLDRLEKAINYICTDPKRFDAALGLAIRPFTIDTWDFTNDPKSQTDRRIHPGEHMCAMHGDNSGLYRAMRLLANMNDKAGAPQKAACWRERAETLKKNMFAHLWNGRFFIHQLHIGPCPIPGEDETERLSLSNAYDMNRGVTDTAQSQSIVDEYIRRRETTSAFAEWFSIDPPYPLTFMGIAPGNYVNGAISPFTAGELARAAFDCGREAYAWSILDRFIEMVKRDGTVYFLYGPEDARPQGGGPSGWGAAALMNAVDEGLAGIEDLDCLYRDIRFSPRFVVTNYKEGRYLTGYEASHIFVDMRWIIKDEGLRYDVISQAERIRARIMLPAGKHAKSAYLNGEPIPFRTEKVGDSLYVCFEAAGSKRVKMEIAFEND